MYYALTSEEMKECDSFTIKNLRPSIELMETAGTNFYDEIIKIRDSYTEEQKFQDRAAEKGLVELAMKENSCVGDDREYRR